MLKRNFRKIKNLPAMLRITMQAGNQGFVILFAVTLSAILLSIALGVANIALKEIKFGTSAKDTNDAFFAADTGAECALNNDKPSSNHFPVGGPASQITCAGSTISPTYSATDPNNSNAVLYNFVVANIGGNSVSCANVNVSKDAISRSPSVITVVTSKGYNIMDNGSCLSSNPNRIERELIVSY